MVIYIGMLGLVLGILGMPLQGVSAAETLVPPSDFARMVVINDLSVDDDSVSGTVVNKSSATLREVKLLLRQVWHWQDERHPGTDSPGRALAFALRADIAPGESAAFTFQCPPLSQRSDGHFVSTMEVTGLSEVGPQQPAEKQAP